MRLENKVALVTGAGGGLGGATAKRFAREGAKVLCSDLDEAKLAVVVAEIEAAGGEAEAIRVDVTKADDCARQVVETVRRFGRIDTVVTSAGVGFHKLSLDTTEADWERVLRINLTGSFLTAQAAARRMVEQAAGGRIIMLGSISGQRGNMGGVAYGASKAGIMHVCKVMAVELSAAGVMVNAIAPGPIETGISVYSEERRSAYLDRIPTGRFGGAESVANAALFLASDDCEWITGHVLNVDGGYGAAGLSYNFAAQEQLSSGS